MADYYLFYVNSLMNDIPNDVYAVLLAISCFGIIALIAWKGIKAWRYLVELLLIDYVVVLLCITVMFREVVEERAYSFKPFWTYREILKGARDDLLPQVIMNIVVFVPIGIMAGVVTQYRNLRSRWMMVIGLGMALSISIEVLQFWCGKGFAELDDVFHNSLGSVMGFVICRSVERWLRR